MRLYSKHLEAYDILLGWASVSLGLSKCLTACLYSPEPCKGLPSLSEPRRTYAEHMQAASPMTNVDIPNHHIHGDACRMPDLLPSTIQASFMSPQTLHSPGQQGAMSQHLQTRALADFESCSEYEPCCGILARIGTAVCVAHS